MFVHDYFLTAVQARQERYIVTQKYTLFRIIHSFSSLFLCCVEYKLLHHAKDMKVFCGSHFSRVFTTAEAVKLPWSVRQFVAAVNLCGQTVRMCIATQICRSLLWGKVINHLLRIPSTLRAGQERIHVSPKNFNSFTRHISEIKI